MNAKINPSQRNNSTTMFQRVTKNDRITDSFNTYGDLIWALASRLTESPEETENIVREILLGLWQDTKRADSCDFDEMIFISIIARRHLLERTIKS